MSEHEAKELPSFDSKYTFVQVEPHVELSQCREDFAEGQHRPPCFG